MSKIAYLECPTGIAGDMCLGAVVDLGVPLDYLTTYLNALSISGEYKLWAESVQRNGQRATQIHVDLLDPHSGEILNFSHPTEAGHHHHHHHHHHEPHEHSQDRLRHLPEIEQMILGAKLPKRVEDWSLAIFRRLAEAEGAVHGVAPDQVHFHEVGAVDAIVDIVGTCLGLDWLGIDQLYCSALPTGGGTIRAAHGRLSVPVPAVLKLWEMRQVPVYHNGIERELVTPTGAAIATTLAVEFGPPPRMTLQKIGLGAGTLELALPNMVRLWIGMTSEVQQTVSVLETQVDDLSPQAIGYLFEALFEAGAVDVFTQAIGMKKSRPGVLLTVICLPEKVAACEAVMFQETTTLGIRHSTQQRSTLDREFQTVETEYGTVQVKVSSREGAIVTVQPEYEDCAQLARKHQIPWKEVHRIALQTWYARQS
jgi:pyridinium-3,5-bisthiocarboxylic acid mononucleotide nickel chelatase